MTRDVAVSPVAGSMLLLTLVIIFTAVFAAYAAGLAQPSESTPSVEIVVYSSGSGETFSLVFDHRGGEALSPANCKITTFIDPYAGSFSMSDIAGDITSWRAGESLTTQNLTYTASLLNIQESELLQYCKLSTPLEIRVYYLPTNALLFTDTILLEETS